MPIRPLLLIWNRVVPEDEATENKLIPPNVDVPWTNKVEELVVVPIATLPLALTVNKETPVEVLIWNGFRVVVP